MAHRPCHWRTSLSTSQPLRWSGRGIWPWLPSGVRLPPDVPEGDDQLCSMLDLETRTACRSANPRDAVDLDTQGPGDGIKTVRLVLFLESPLAHPPKPAPCANSRLSLGTTVIADGAGHSHLDPIVFQPDTAHNFQGALAVWIGRCQADRLLLRHWSEQTTYMYV